MASNLDNKKVISWALYDWANSAFATTVLAGFFPLFFKEYWSAGADVATSTLRLGAANSIGSIVVATLAPALGAIADRGSAKKRFLMIFSAMGIVATGALHFVAQGSWAVAAALFVMASIGFAGGNIFYDSLLVSVAPENRFDFVSALGFSLGYLGGGLLFALDVWMTLSPQTFGLRDATQAVQVSFLSVAVWWALFAVPVLLFVPEPRKALGMSLGPAVGAGFRQLVHTFQQLRRLRVVFLFLGAYWLYIDGVDTIVRMAVDYGMSLGFDANSLIMALLITQFVGFPAAIVFGKMGERFGTKPALLVGIGAYTGITVWGTGMQQTWEFYGVAVCIGLVQGGVQSLSRSFYARLIPPDKSAEFFGFYNMLGKFAAVIGPILMGWTAILTEDPRLSLLSVIILFAAGGLMLYFVDEAEGHRMAERMRNGAAA